MKITYIRSPFLCIISCLFSYSIESSPIQANLIVLLDYGQSEELLRQQGANQAVASGPFTPLGALTSTLIPALYQQAAPLLVSRSLLSTIMHRKQIFHDCLTRSHKELHHLYGKLHITKATSLGQFKRHCQYADKMYRKIIQEVTPIFKTGSQAEIDKAITALTSHKQYLEEAAPRSLQLYSGPTPSTQEILHRELQGYALCYYAPLTTEDYSIKEVSQELVLLIPKKLCGTHTTTYIPYASWTQLEMQLGCKVNHLPDIASTQEFLKKYPITYDVSLQDALSKSLITRKEKGNHTFVVYLAGHGLPVYPERIQKEQLQKLSAWYEQKTPHVKDKGERKERKVRVDRSLVETERTLSTLPTTHEKIINSLSFAEFKKVLHFLNSDISCSLLLYSSCYAGGEHLVIPYQGATQKLSYDCIVVSVSDALSFQDSPMLLLPPYKCSVQNSQTFIQGITEDSFDVTEKRLKPYTSTRFDLFFKQAHTGRSSSEELVQYLHPYIRDGKPLVEYLENVPHLRPKGAPHFNLIEKKPSLTVLPPSGTISSELHIGFLERPRYGKLAFPGSLKALVSLKPGPTSHLFEQIDSPLPLTELCKIFLALPSLPTPKLFWIKEVRCTDTQHAFPFEWIRSIFGSHTSVHNLIIARNIVTTDGLAQGTLTNIFFSDAQESTWHIPVSDKLEKASRVDTELLYGELSALFPELKTSLKSNIQL